ncbi:hypothetical protein CF326_g7482 [Tilletia indica]|nr:hypothetical protein CF326_g7482 [Tilletia indica]
MDGTGSLLVLAWALSPGETEESWTWFVTNLRDSLSGLNDASSAIVSDRNAGLLNAIESVLPAATSIFCCFHLAKNNKDRHYSAAAVQLPWRMVYATTESQFKGHLDSLATLDKEAVQYQKDIDPNMWATYAITDRGRRYGHFTSNLAEIANAMVLEARELPPLLCLDHIYRHQMERYFSRRISAINCTSPIVPSEYARLKDARRMTTVCSDEKSGCVSVTSSSGKQFVVNLPRNAFDVGTCDCRQYQLLLRPCKHAIALILKLK